FALRLGLERDQPNPRPRLDEEPQLLQRRFPAADEDDATVRDREEGRKIIHRLPAPVRPIPHADAVFTHGLFHHSASKESMKTHLTTVVCVSLNASSRYFSAYELYNTYQSDNEGMAVRIYI